MSDNDQTILSTRGAAGVPGAPQPEEETSKRNPLFIIGGIGCALLLCAGLLIGGGFYVAGEQVNDIVAQLQGQSDAILTTTPTEEPEATEEAQETEPTATSAPTETPQPAEEPTAEADNDDSGTAEAGEDEEQDSAAVAFEPEIGGITFASGATEDYEPIDPNTAFEGDITEIHAIFEYSGFPPDAVWERVWYLDGEEMLRGEEAWSGGEEGIFDYFINNAGGEPLLAGKWELELYVEGDLLADGSFTIVANEEDAVAGVSGPDDETEATPDTGTEDSEEPATPGSDDEAESTPDAGNEDSEKPTATATVAATATTTPTVAATATVTPTVAVTATTTPRPVSKTYQLAYTKWDGGKHVLFVGDTNGSSEQYIISRAAGPSWTPDGRYLFVYGEEGIDRQTVNGVDYNLDGVTNGIVRIDASPLPANIEQVRLYQGPGWNDGTARWANVSPNGQMVAFDARPGGDYRIYFLGTDESQQFRFELLGEQGDWSPDSQKVVYRSGRDGKTGIWVSNRDDSGHTLLTNGGSDSFPAWSPDGRTIVFHRDEGGNVDLYAMNADGSNVRRLTDAPGPDTLPVFTPGGEIIFRSARSGSWSIWKMNGDGSNQREIISGAGVGPDWSFSRMSVLP